MLYRLDFIDSEGRAADPVQTLGRDFLSRHMTTARAYARAEAAATERAILITRIGKSGQMRPTLVIHPDGLSTRPQGTRTTGAGGDCTATPDGPPCFCANCRAARRAER